MREPNETQLSRIAGYLGIAQKAGKIVAGDNLAKEALIKKKAELLVLANDAAQWVKDELISLAEAESVPMVFWPDKTGLGLLVGKSPSGALVVLDKRFAKAIVKVIGE